MAAVEHIGLRERREKIVNQHIDVENRHDIEATIATFDLPCYEVCVDTASDGREIGPSGFPKQISAELVMRRAGMPLELFAT